MAFLAKWFGSKTRSSNEPVDETEAKELETNIKGLEEQLKMDPSCVKIQQELVAKYSRAASVFAQSPSYRDKVSGVFTRMNELRNAARTSF